MSGNNCAKCGVVGEVGAPVIGADVEGAAAGREGERAVGEADGCVERVVVADGHEPAGTAAVDEDAVVEFLGRSEDLRVAQRIVEAGVDTGSSIPQPFSVWGRPACKSVRPSSMCSTRRMHRP